MKKNDQKLILEEIAKLSAKTDSAFGVIKKLSIKTDKSFQVMRKGFKSLKEEFVEVKEEFVEVKNLSIKTNNSLQDIKQDIMIFKEENKKEHEEMKKESKVAHEELKKLILAGDTGAAELIVDEEAERGTVAVRVTLLEKDVRKIKQKVFA